MRQCDGVSGEGKEYMQFSRQMLHSLYGFDAKGKTACFLDVLSTIHIHSFIEPSLMVHLLFADKTDLEIYSWV